MEIKIKNYGGIGEMETEIEDEKINFIYGPSGSGKTSLVKIFTDTNPEENKKIGEEEMIVNLSPDPREKVSVSIYNEKTVEQLLAEKAENEDFYKILFSEGESIDNLRNEAIQMFSDISSKLPKMNQFIEDVDNLIRKINGRKNLGKEGFSKNSTISKLENESENENYKGNCKIIKQYGEQYIHWIEEGIKIKEEMYSKEKCPFCQRKLTTYRRNTIENILSINRENYKFLYESEEQLNKFGIELPKYEKISEIKKTKDALLKLVELRDEVYKIIKLVDIKDYGIMKTNDYVEIKCSKQFKKMFPDIYDVITKLNQDMQQIRIKISRINRQTTSVINKNLEKINSYLSKLSIPYKFCPQKFNSSSRTASFILKHIKDSSNEDRRNFLSHGEKNIIALLLYIYSQKSDIIIVDDPASSADENKRRIILELIEEKHKNETIIILSHDQVFIKYAVLSKYDSKKSNQKIGIIGCMENINSKCYIKPIYKSSFDALENQIGEFIKSEQSMPYYRMIINARLLAEIKCRNNRKVYGYLSAILHGETRESLYHLLEISPLFSSGTAKEREEEVLKVVEKKIGISLPSIPGNCQEGFDYKNLTSFEKAIYLREEKTKSRKKGKKSEFEKELDDIVHMNNSYCISLNPYQYSTFSPHVHNEIKLYEGGE